MASIDRSGSGWSSTALALAAGVSLVGALAGCNDIFDSKSCTVDGRLYPAGMTFKPAGDCNTCTCGPDGQVACTLIACDPPAEIACALDATYNYGFEGGDSPRQVLSTLSPPASYSSVYSPVPAGAAVVGCAPALPSCSDPTKIDAWDIVRDLRQQDVLAALGQPTPPIYGQDQRPVDGAIYGIHRADGHGMLVGSPCPSIAVTLPTSCVPIPPGVQQLVDDLKALDQQQHQDPSCVAFSPAATPLPGP